MASVTSLGLHQPTALEYAIREQILPENPSSDSYEWEITVDKAEADDDVDGECEDELLVTKDTVIWSRGCVFRKCFGFRLEKEPITQALLTYFPNNTDAEFAVDNQDNDVPKGDSKAKGDKKRKQEQDKLSRALVVFLQTQAHIYFLDGTSHVVHMPFEVEAACAAPQGVIIQRRARHDHALANSVKFPRVPPNSFVSNNPHHLSPVALRTSQQSTFSTDTLGKPPAMPFRLSSNLNTVWDSPGDQSDTHWPRLIILTDPLLELGLVVTRPDASTRRRSHRSQEKAHRFLDKADEIVHIESISRPGASKKSEPITLAVTVNRETSMYTVWRFSRIRNADPFVGSKKPQRRKSERRRSSMQPGQPAGAATPVPASSNLRESFGAPMPGKRPRKSERIEKADRALENLETSLGIDKETAATRRSSRRVSSMLARADLSASQDRTSFAEQPQMSNHPTGRRDTSHGSQRHRASGVSFGGSVAHNVNALGSFLEAPVDDLLEELRSGGDFEGFHTMGLDDHDFDGLAEEALFTKIHSVPIDNSNVRYSLSRKPARTQCKVFFLCGPQSLVDENQHRWQVLIGIQDPMEKRLQLLTLHIQSVRSSRASTPGAETASVTFGQLRKAQNVIDSCKITDGLISMILVLSQSADGQREMSLQAPWSLLTSITLPRKLSLANLTSLDYGGSLVNREVGIRRAVTPVVGEIGGLRHSKLRGLVDVMDEDTRQLHQVRIQLQPSSPYIVKILELLPSALPVGAGEKLLAGWWDILNWLREQDVEVADQEWSALVILLFTIFLALGPNEASAAINVTPSRRKSRAFLRSSSGAHVDLSDWDTMNLFETPNASTHPSWVDNKAWQWIQEENESGGNLFLPSGKKDRFPFINSHAKHSLAYMSSAQGEAACGPQGFIPTSSNVDDECRPQHTQSIFLALHLLLEEEKLSITSSRYSSPGPLNLRAVLLQAAQWLGWVNWVSLYELDMPLDWPEDRTDTANLSFSISVPQPPCWSGLDWVASNLSNDPSPLPSLPTLLPRIQPSNLPRISMFAGFFKTLQNTNLSPTDFVNSMYENGITPFILETLPESVLAPLKDAITQCQASPPPTWTREKLELVDRADVGTAFSVPKTGNSHAVNILAPTHVASWDFSSLCQNYMDFNDLPADDVAESDKQAVIRAIIKEDRRLEEIRFMLTTTKPRVVRLDPEPEWSESVYLEQQKELTTRLATNTLSIPAGRGLMNYGLRFPLLTQKFHVNGFVLNCTVKPSNNTVGVDKSLFTEEKIAWAFFHSGVAAGLSISRQAKGIDTSWILYNKPGNDLNNRHAGFLLALGLNGHLKGMAKWVAFKYLTPKHTMTSIGLLLGLAASYMGTMDSLITRLLSVHVTRMLPRGAAELNLSPLTQTTGIMGIGLLYCGSQHRRMSEIMMSEIEHVESEDDEDPLRNECYRLASGFALGFINLGKGTDLKGLHDMRITEKLLTLATATKKIEHVHVLDRSTAAAVVAIALIYMKSGDHIVARKIDVPEAPLQFDYIRPDILLLRTVAKHLVLWAEMRPTHDWIRSNMPQRYKSRIRPDGYPLNEPGQTPLNSTNLPLFTILAGLCFSLGLRYAGSGDTKVRDLLLAYLQHYYAFRGSPDPKTTCFDERMVWDTGRMCLDIIAISCAIVMAGSCDLKVLRVLRSLHGREGPEGMYGSHMATHMAIGVLSLGCGTQTFTTSNIAVGSLLVAFYPVFPDSVQDNKSHLQAFRHFWVLATDPRCLVTKDVATNSPVSVPITIRLKDAELQKGRKKKKKQSMGATAGAGDGDQNIILRTTPCLLPPIEDIISIRTTSPEFWNLELDLTTHPEYVEAFRRTQSLHLRRRPITDSPFAATLLALADSSASGPWASASPQGGSAGAPGNMSSGGSGPQPLEWLFDAVPTLNRLTRAERDAVLDRGIGGPDASQAGASAVDARLALEEDIGDGAGGMVRRDGLLGLRGLFAWAEWRAGQKAEALAGTKQGVTDSGGGSSSGQDWVGEAWLRESVVEDLKGRVWMAGREAAGE